MAKFPASTPRRMFWSKDVGGHSHCPECGGILESDYHTYLLAVRDRGEVETFVTGNDSGYFCKTCPIVVLDSEAFAKFSMLGLRRETSGEFAVMGIVDLEAVPQEKRSMPLGGDDNPLPLVAFIGSRFSRPGRSKIKRSRSKRKHSRSRKKRRR